jgi:hypothetical protein
MHVLLKNVGDFADTLLDRFVDVVNRLGRGGRVRAGFVTGLSVAYTYPIKSRSGPPGCSLAESVRYLSTSTSSRSRSVSFELNSGVK